ncbi:class I adenylate-forming enzyme family protein [Mesorhizobium sp. ANAO-SY3R2]|uniref:class I adenylate-forming enzyme family protein n=1 Tax=Mesorhizobium sp. ANAO-SY3R2 TaxID=3166644 RepID=UPI00367100D7
MTLLRLTHRILDLAVSTTPNGLAASLEDRTVTFSEVDRAANAMARVLQSLGIGRGSRILFQAEMALDHLAFYFATQRLGAAFVPVNPALSPDEVRPIAEYIRPDLLVLDPARQDGSSFATAGADISVAVLGAGEAATSGINLDVLAGKASTAPLPDLGVSEDDTHAIFLTSGSTGRPKGVVLSHRASWLRSYLGASRFVTSGGRGELMTFPMFHWAGWNYLMENWAHRRAAHFVSRPDGDTLARAIDRWKPAFFYCIPAIWERVLAAKTPFDGSVVRSAASGTSRFDPVLMDRIRARFPRAYRAAMYGSTEFGGALGLNDSDIERKPGSVGLPNPGNEARIVDGELQLRSMSMMDGYFELPEQTAEVFIDGWYRSGDLAEADAEGYLTITGRRREVIRSGGETVAPAEVELAMAGLPGIRSVAVIGVPDPVWGELVCAAVVLERSGECPSLEALRAHLGPALAAFKHPRRIVAVDDLPKTPATGQIMRSRVREMVLQMD